MVLPIPHRVGHPFPDCGLHFDTLGLSYTYYSIFFSSPCSFISAAVGVNVFLVFTHSCHY